ncbi:MAG: nicotinamide mononucleotide transporter [Betaproteobacteria bacterium]
MDTILFTTPWFAVTPTNVLEALFVTFSIIGQEFIVRRDRRGFRFFIVGNVIAIVMFLALGRWMSCVLYVYFIVKSVQGSANWRNLEQQASQVISHASGGAPGVAARSAEVSLPTS